MKMNNRGFTLIESIITFAIIALAGGMFLLGFYNVATIASEGSIIKTETNNLYNDLLSDVDTIKTENKSISLTIEGRNTPLEIPVIGISKSVTLENKNPFNIRLTYFKPENSAEKLPNNPIEEEEDYSTYYNADVYLLRTLGQMPVSYENIKDIDYNYVHIGLIDNAINPKTEQYGTIFDISAGKYIANSPNKSVVDELLNDTEFEGQYTKWLTSEFTQYSYEFKWICIDYNNVNYDSNGKKQVRLYGYLQKVGGRTLNLLIENGKSYFLNIDNGNVEITDEIYSSIKDDVFRINNELYTGEQIKNNMFIKDGATSIYIGRLEENKKEGD